MPDALDQPIKLLAEITQPPRRPVPKQLTPFTSQTASLFARRRHELERLAKASQPIITLSPKPASDDYTAARIVRVRGQLDKVDKMLLEADDAQEIERLSRSAMSLSEQLRVLLDIPLPGSRKPPAVRSQATVSRPSPMIPQAIEEPKAVVPTTEKDKPAS